MNGCKAISSRLPTTAVVSIGAAVAGAANTSMRTRISGQGAAVTTACSARSSRARSSVYFQPSRAIERSVRARWRLR